MFQLLFEDGDGGPDVGKGIVGTVEGLACVAAVGFVEAVAVDVALDFEDVEEAGAFFWEINADPGEFFHEHGYVEIVGIVACEVSTGKPLGEALGDVPDNGCILHIFIRKAVDVGGSCGDGDAGVD